MNLTSEQVAEQDRINVTRGRLLAEYARGRPLVDMLANELAHYYDVPHPAWHPINRTRFWQRQRVKVVTPFALYWYGLIPLRVPPGDISDGLSIPVFVELLTFRRLHAFAPGVVPAFVHDEVCEHPERAYYMPATELNGCPMHDARIMATGGFEWRPMTRPERALIFRDALAARAAIINSERAQESAQAVGLVTSTKPTRLQRRLWQGVKAGSKYFGYC